MRQPGKAKISASRSVSRPKAERKSVTRKAPRKPDPTALIAQMGIPDHELSPVLRRALGKLLVDNASLRTQLVELRAELLQAQEAADRDVLLSVLNRRALMREISRVISFAGRYRACASLLYVDLDGFKAINDRFGHAAGDAALHHVAHLFKKNIRESDSLGRIGGDEFAMILAQADFEGARTKAEYLVKLLAKSQPKFEGVVLPISFSYGIHCFDKDDSAENALARADEAMYAAKVANRQKFG